jgi:protein-S-isoprenylcysteine O-methyltransferase Ste14
MPHALTRIIRFFRLTAVQTFLLVPIATLVFEILMRGGALRFQPAFLLLWAWGFAQYALCRRYRLARGGGGPGLKTPPERIVTTGAYAWTRNPMYLGHIVYMIGVAAAFESAFGAALAIARAVWFHLRVLGDEKRLAERFGESYLAYTRRVTRWIPGLF